MKQELKAGRYQRIYAQLKDLFLKPGNDLSRMATLVAVVHHKMDYFFWTGFYLLDGDKLVAGPYQGPVACQLLDNNTGVCWSAITRKESIIVPDVHLFPGHIACDSRSNSEIVVPLKNKEGHIIGVLDVDSKDLNAFDETDKHGLEQIIALLSATSSSSLL
jgi:L-methionine (R)-S-oxide reductase